MDVPDKWIEKHGGWWYREHPNFPVEDWKYEILNGDTRLGYWEWAYKQAEVD